MFSSAIPEDTSSVGTPVRAAVLRAVRLTVCVVGLMVLFGSAGRGVAGVAPDKAKLVENYGKVPLSFEPNKGQTSAKVQWVARGSEYALFLSGDDAVLELNSIAPAKGVTERLRIESAAIRMNLIGAKPADRTTGEGQQAGTANYFTGNDPSKWQNDVPTFEKVRLSGVYPGIDLVYYGRQGRLEYDFVVAPGADAAKIALKFEGAEARLAENGDLVLPVAGTGHEVRFDRPTVYQMKDGKRQMVEGGFHLATDRTVSFELGSYDRGRELVIDPTLLFAGSIATGNQQTIPAGMVIDATGAMYLTGYTNDLTFPVTTGALQTNCQTYSSDAAANGFVRCGPSSSTSGFVTKISADGTSLVYSTYLHGGGGQESGQAIAVDAAGDAYVLGATSSNDFPITANAYQTLCQPTYSQGGNFVPVLPIVAQCDNFHDGGGTEYTVNGPNLFISKLNPTGTALLYSTFFGGSQSVYPVGIALDQAGNIYFASELNLAQSPTNLYPNNTQLPFPTTTSGYQTTGNNLLTPALSKLSADGQTLLYSTFLGSLGADSQHSYNQGFALGTNGVAFIGGYTAAANFPTTAASLKPACGLNTNNINFCATSQGFVAAFDTTKSGAASLIYSSYLGGEQLQGSNIPEQEVYGLLVDAANDLFVTGYTSANDYPSTAGVFQPHCNDVTPTGNCNQTAFLSKINPAGSGFVWSTFFGDTRDAGPSSYGASIAFDSKGLVYLYGLSADGGQITEVDPISTYTSGNKVFLATFSADATKLKFATRFSGPSNNGISLAPSGNGLAVDAAGSMYIIGYSNDNGAFGTTAGTYSTTATSGFNRPFFAKISRVTGQSATTLAITPSPASSGGMVAFSVAVAGDGSTTTIPSGTVTITVTGVSPTPTVLGTITLDGTGKGVLSTNTLGSGTYSVQAAYSGDSNNEPSMSAVQSLTVTATLTTNLLLNPGAELGSLADWTSGGTGTPQVDTGTYDAGVDPHTGVYDFVGGYKSGTDSLSQTVSIVQQGITAAQVDGGTLFASVSFWEQGLSQGTPSDDGSVTLTFLNATNASIGTVTTSTVDSHDGTWANGTGAYSIPVGTRSITYAMNFVKNQLTDNDAFFDDNSLSIGTNTGLTIFPGRLHFGNVAVGSQSSTQTVSVTNQQMTTITIEQILSELGANPADFIETDNCPGALASGASCTLTVKFVPGGVGFKSAGVAINTDNVPALQQVSVDGTGTGGILQLNPGNLKTVAGNGTFGTTGDGGPAIMAELQQPNGVAFDPSGNLYLADDEGNVVRKVDTAGNISTFAGVGTRGFAGDGGLATQAELSMPFSVTSDKNGNIYIEDTGNDVIRKVDGGTGIITTFAGTPGTPGHLGDGGPATAARFNQNQGSRFDSAGNLYVPTCMGPSVRKIDTAANITTVAGNFTAGFSGDGGPATAGQLQCPSGVTIDAAGNLYIADEFNQVIRKVTAAGVISTIAGTPGVAGFSGDGGAATSAMFHNPNDVVLDAAGNLYVADSANNRVRKIDANGVITTAAGGLNNAGSAAVNTPLGVTVDTAGNVYFTDSGNSAVREIFPQGTQPFPATRIGMTAPAQSLTLSNIGNTAVTLAAGGAFTTSGNAGDFALTPGTCGGGAVLAANGGACAVSVTFKPTAVGQRVLTVTIADNALNTPQSFSIGGMGTAAQGTPVAPRITWAMPAAITTATPLGSMQLDATATDGSGTAVPGTFVYTPAAGAMLMAGTQTLSVTFTPTDTADFTTAMGTTTIVVTQASGGPGSTGTATTTTLAVTAGTNPVTTVAAGAVVTLTASVKAGTNVVKPAQVAFCDAAATSCTESNALAIRQITSGGTAVYRLVPGLGAHSYRAIFLGTNTYAASASATTALMVTGTIATTTTIAQSGAAGNYTLTATTVGALPYPAQAATQPVTINLGQSAQNYVLTGTGSSTANGGTYGNYYNTQGSCVTAGATTTCDLTGPFTSSSTTYPAGTYDFQTTFSGSVASAVLSQTQSPVGTNEPNDFQYSAVAASTVMTLKLIVNGGGAYTIPVLANGSFDPSLDNVNFKYVSPVCGGTSLGTAPCQQDYVGTVAGATYSGVVTGAVLFEMPVPPTLLGPTGTVSFLDTTKANAALATGALGTATTALGFGSALINAASIGAGVAMPGDLNGDGKLDLVFTNRVAGTLTVLLGKGDGTFTAAASLTTGAVPSAAVLADFNNDGILDVAVTNENDNTVTILLGRGDGTFTAAETAPPTRSGPGALVKGDFNGDGNADLIVTNAGDGTVTILLGNGDGTFNPNEPFGTGGTPGAIVAGDFNGDGKLDIAIAVDNQVNVYLGRGDGSFALSTNTATNAISPNSLAVADVNKDGKLDLVVADDAGYPDSDGNGGVFVLLGNGDGTFTAAASPVVGKNPSSVVAADLNGDGIVDLAVVNLADSTSSILVGKGDGTFTALPTVTTANAPTAITAGDFNGDGYPDLVVATEGAETVSGPAVSLLLTQLTETAIATATEVAPAGAGNHAVVASFAGDANFVKSVSAATNLAGTGAAAPVTPTITWAMPAPITTATPLSALQLDATATDASGAAVAGVFAYTPPAGALLAAGTQTLSVTFTPTDTTDFTTATKTVQIVVTQGMTAPAATTTMLAVSSGDEAVTTVAAGSVVTLTASVSASQNSVTPGQVAFCDATAATCTGIHVLATAELVGGDTTSTATFRFVPGMGAHSYKAVFLGTTAEAGSSSTAAALAVTGKEATATALAATGVQGSYALTATLDGLGFGAPTGSVVFTDSSTNGTLGTVPVSGVARGFVTGGALPGAPVAAGTAAAQIISADVNGDGKLDLVVANSSGTMVTVLLGNGDGTYTKLPAFGTNYNGITGVAVADFNGDGKLDIATANQSTVGIFLGNGDGTFGAETDFANTNTSAGVFPGDFNGDGKIDLAVPDRFNGMTILIGNGDGTFTQPNEAFAVGASPNYHSAVADFNGDGKLDIAAGNFFDNTVSILLGNGDGTFAAPVAYATGGAPTATFAGDFNGDGFPDIVLSNSNDGTISVLLGNGDGTFKAQQTYAVGASPNDEAIGDLNGDGKVDIAVANQSDGTVSILYGNGDGTFQKQVVLTAGTGASSVAIGDANGDGTPDLGVANAGNNTVSVFLNETTAAITLPGVTLPGTGMDNVVATYAGDTVFTGSTSNTLTLASNVVGTTVITWTPSVGTIGYGTALGAQQLNATAATAAGVAIPGTFVYTPAAGTVLAAGTHVLGVAFTPTAAGFSAATGMARILVTPATPVITWAAPAGIAYGTPLSATQLDATVKGFGTGALAGTLVYTPAAGAVLMPGTQTLSVVFTPTDAVDYTTATATVPITVGGLALTSFSPVGALIGSTDTKITLTGTGFVTTSVVMVNGGAVGTTYVGPTMLTALIPAVLLKTSGSLAVAVVDPTIDAATPAQTFTVLPATGAATLTGPAMTQPGSQPTVGLTITNPYPVALTAVFNLTFASSGATQVDDPSIQFSSGGRMFSDDVAPNSTTVPPVQLQAGTDAGTITVTATLMADGVDVTPAGLAPLVIVVPAVVPVISGTTITSTGETLTVVVHGFSNTREVSSAVFDFTAAKGDALATSMLTLPVTTVFGGWYGDTASDAYGSTFTYTQVFNTSADASTIGAVKVTLTNSVGTSDASTSAGP